MTREEELLVITMEECGEVVQACSKMLRFGVGHKKLQEEVGDLMCMLELLHNEGLVSQGETQKRIQVKLEKLQNWSNL